MSRNARWTEKEQRKVVWKIVDKELIQKTEKGSAERQGIIDEIVDELINDPDFSARQNAADPRGTIAQHVRVWIKHLEDKGERPPIER